MFDQLFTLETDGLGTMEMRKIILNRIPDEDEGRRMYAEYMCTINWMWDAHYDGNISVNGWGQTALEAWVDCLNRSAKLGGMDFEKLMAKIALSLVMTASEVSEKYDLDDATARKLATKGRIPARQAGSTWLIPTEIAKNRWGNHANRIE